MPKAIICDSEDSKFKGEITISSGCVIHPSVTIIAKSGPIIIGENCIIEEYATIIYDIGDTNTNSSASTLVIGPNNVFEVGCQVEAAQIGERNVFECKCYVSSKVKISNGCIIGASCKLFDEQYLSENTIIYGKECLQREAIEKQGVIT